MTGFAGRDLLLKTGDGATPQVFHAVGAARSVALDLANDLRDVTPVAGGVVTRHIAGGQSLRISLRGLFKDSAAETRLRSMALAAGPVRCQLCFGNGDIYEADFLVESYRRDGVHDGMEGFACVLLRTGEGIWTTP